MTAADQSTVDVVISVVEVQLNFGAHGLRIGPDDDLWDMGMTSLTCLGVLLGIEDATGVQLPEDALTASTFRSAGTIAAAVESARSIGRE